MGRPQYHTETERQPHFSTHVVVVQWFVEPIPVPEYHTAHFFIISYLFFINIINLFLIHLLPILQSYLKHIIIKKVKLQTFSKHSNYQDSSRSTTSKYHHVDFGRPYVDSLLVKHNQLVWTGAQNLPSAQNLALSIFLHKVKVLILAHYHPLDLKLILSWSSNLFIHLVLHSLFRNQLFSQLQLDLLNDSVAFVFFGLFIRILIGLFWNRFVVCCNGWLFCRTNGIFQFAFLMLLNDWSEAFGLWNCFIKLNFWFRENVG